jgi:hypothetical protein
LSTHSSVPAIHHLIANLAALASTESLFNPYSDPFPGASARRENLTRYLGDMLLRQPHILMLFEAPGYRGCALTGIPVTSERIMLTGIPEWELFGAGYRATSGDLHGVSENTATILWSALRACAGEPPLIWNTVPLHPHKPGNRQSNRAPLVREERMGLPFIEDIIRLSGFETILAVGRTAQRALETLGRQAIPLRHPSQGGKPEFVRGLREVYGK